MTSESPPEVVAVRDQLAALTVRISPPTTDAALTRARIAAALRLASARVGDAHRAVRDAQAAILGADNVAEAVEDLEAALTRLWAAEGLEAAVPPMPAWPTDATDDLASATTAVRSLAATFRVDTTPEDASAAAWHTYRGLAERVDGAAALAAGSTDNPLSGLTVASGALAVADDLEAAAAAAAALPPTPRARTRVLVTPGGHR